MTRSAEFEFNISPPSAIWRWGAVPMSTESWSSEIANLFRGFGARFDDHATWATFMLPEQFENAQLAMGELRSRGIEPVVHYATVKNPPRTNIHSVKWYGVMHPDSSKGFISEGMFENEWPCELPTPELVTGVRGCSLRKKQIRKLKIGRPDEIRRDDFISASLPFYSFPWQRLVVSARLRDALGESGLSGFSFLPVAGPDASAQDLLLESGLCQTDSADWFQMIIEGRAQPRPIDDFIPVKRADGKRECRICGRQTGEPQLQPLFGEDLLSAGADIQVCEDFELPDGTRVMNADGGLYASSRFVEFCLREKFKGLSSLTGRAPHFTALYLGPAVQPQSMRLQR